VFLLESEVLRLWKKDRDLLQIVLAFS
jgi:hypothetical protein